MELSQINLYSNINIAGVWVLCIIESDSLKKGVV